MPKTWFITGTTSGFGEQLCRQVLARGDKVITGSRDANRRAYHLIELGAHVIDLDLTWNHVRIEQTVRKAIDDCGGNIDYLFSVAGYGLFDAFEEISQERLLEFLQVSLHGHINMTRAVLPYMREQRSGRIGIVGSVAGWVGLPGSTPYCIAKYGLEGFVDSLSLEVEPLGIKVLIVEPGDNRTNFYYHLDRNRQPRYAVYDWIRKEVDNLPGTTQEGWNNPAITAKRMIETITGTGLAAGKAFPPRLPLGRDTLMAIRGKCVNTLKLLLDWDEVILSTSDRNGPEPLEGGLQGKASAGAGGVKAGESNGNGNSNNFAGGSRYGNGDDHRIVNGHDRQNGDPDSGDSGYYDNRYTKSLLRKKKSMFNDGGLSKRALLDALED